MDIVAAAGNHRFTLTHELELPDTIWLAFIEDLKRLIPSSGRSYDTLNKEWTIADEWWSTVEALRKRHFSDPNQLDLLGEDERKQGIRRQR